jgi:hypothetical protein
MGSACIGREELLVVVQFEVSKEIKPGGQMDCQRFCLIKKFQCAELSSVRGSAGLRLRLLNDCVTASRAAMRQLRQKKARPVLERE